MELGDKETIAARNTVSTRMVRTIRIRVWYTKLYHTRMV